LEQGSPYRDALFQQKILLFVAPYTVSSQTWDAFFYLLYYIVLSPQDEATGAVLSFGFCCDETGMSVDWNRQAALCDSAVPFRPDAELRLRL
jgi:hypothetical protein